MPKKEIEEGYFDYGEKMFLERYIDLIENGRKQERRTLVRNELDGGVL